MSLVDYSSDEDDEKDEEEKEQQQQSQVSQLASSSSSKASSARMPASSQAPVVGTSLKLPDASQLFSSFNSVKGSTVLNLLGESVSSKKRSDLNGSAEAPPKKIPKGSLIPLRIAPDTAGGSLVPPQLRGRI